MKLLLTKQRDSALTRLDVLVSILIAVLLFAALMPVSHSSKERAQRIICVSNLKQITMAMRIWEGDNTENPKIPTNENIPLGLNSGQLAWIDEMGFSNIVSSRKILLCPADKDPTPTNPAFPIRISYFMNVDVAKTYPQMMISGDDNLATNGIPVGSGLLKITSTMPVSWTAARHKYCGNIAFADGSVAEESNQTMTNWVGGTDLTNRIAIP